MRVLALVFLLSACGPLAETPAPADMAKSPDLVEPYVAEDDDSNGMPPGGGAPWDPCQYAICNNPDDRVKYLDPAPFLPQTLPTR